VRPLLCLLVPLALPGCYLAHERPSGRDAGARPDAPASDASAPDASAPDAGACAPREVELLCTAPIRAGVPGTVELTYAPSDECFCGQTIGCEARIVEPGRLALTTTLCPEVAVCRACSAAPTALCTLPALPTPGVWRLEVNGRTTMQLDVAPEGVVPEPAALCVRHTPPGGCGDYTPEPFEVGRACHAPEALPGTRVPIRVYEACGSCTSVGPCEVTVRDGVVRVAARRMQSDCGLVCPPVCMNTEHVCWTPPLLPGRYDVVVEGLPEPVTTPLDVSAEPRPPTEICAGR
jgi:hypothetical protein